jgi:hypothetical protein
VKKVIEREFSVRYHQNYISRLLADLDWSVQKPDPRAIERDEELIRVWLSRDWPRIKNKAQLDTEIVFEDEFGLSYSEPVSFIWAPRGQTPQLKRIGKYRWETSTIVGLTITGKIYKHPEIHVEYLPAYAPELNLGVYCHGNVKQRLKNAIFQSKTEIRHSLDLGVSRLRKRFDILLGCFQHAGPNLKQFWKISIVQRFGIYAYKFLV